jgi:deazaflavin-dependent oxidoreductase (nitroreductase family)
MWFMNKIVNPLVKMILRSPLHRLMSATLLLITYRGRKSGKEYTLPVQYVQDGSYIFIVPGYAEQKTWWHNLKGGLDVQLMLKGQALSGQGTLLESEANAEEILKAFGLYLQYFPQSAKIHNVRIEADGRLNPDDLRQAVKTIKMIQVKLNERNTDEKPRSSCYG